METLPWPLDEHRDLRDGLLRAYDDPGRGYHDRRHLAEVLMHVGRLCDAGERADRQTVLLAAWYHDAVYDGAPDDEERSADLAGTQLGAAGVAADVLAEVGRLVRLTASHRPEPGDSNGQVLCDADLAILAAGPRRYREYVAGVRREYADLEDAVFRQGRAAVLADLLALPTLFGTVTGRAWWEEAARANAQRELAGLRAGPAGPERGC